MPLSVVFDMPGVTVDQYDAVIDRLEQAGEGKPSGRLYHVASPTDGGWLVVDVWEDSEKLDRFAAKLLPIMQEAGIPPTQPRVSPTHNVIPG